jgi:hypothetical protein
MRLSGREDMALGISDAFRLLSDFDFLERQILRRGIEIVRTDRLADPGPGVTWTAKPSWKGRDYPMVLEISEWSPPTGAVLTSASGGLVGELNAELVALSRNSTRLRMFLTVKGQTFRDRMFLQSAKLAKSGLETRFSGFVSALAKSAEARAEQALATGG